jgi:tetratricopeptide (TPR) repeat protein
MHISSYKNASGDPSGAIAVWKKYTSVYPEDTRGYWYLASLLANRTDEDTALVEKVFRAWYKLDPGSRQWKENFSTYCGERANSLRGLGDVPGAEFWYKRIIASDSGRIVVYNDLATLYAQKGRITEALALLFKAMAIDSNVAYIYDNIGNCYFHKGDYQQSIVFYQKALLKDPTLPNVAASITEASHRLTGGVTDHSLTR